LEHKFHVVDGGSHQKLRDVADDNRQEVPARKQDLRRVLVVLVFVKIGLVAVWARPAILKITRNLAVKPDEGFLGCQGEDVVVPF